MISLAHLSLVTIGVTFGLGYFPLLPCSFEGILAFSELITSLSCRASLDFNTAWSRQVSNGITPASASRTLILVALHAPVIALKAKVLIYRDIWHIKPPFTVVSILKIVYSSLFLTTNSPITPGFYMPDTPVYIYIFRR